MITISLTAKECDHILTSLRCFQTLYEQALDNPDMSLENSGAAVEIAKERDLLSPSHLDKLYDRINKAAKAQVKNRTNGLDRFVGIAVDGDEGQFSIDFIVAKNIKEADELLRKMRSYSDDCEVYSLSDWAEVAQNCIEQSTDEVLAKMRFLMKIYGEVTSDVTTESPSDI